MKGLSDYRLKSNIKPIEGALQKLMKLKPREYDFYDPNQIGENKKHEIGFIAQEIIDVLPEIVNKPEHNYEYWSIEYGKLTSLIVSALQEVSRDVAIIKKKFKDVEIEIDDIN